MKNGHSQKKTPFVPRYQRIYNDLKKKIQDGVYPEGAQLPVEHALCTEYGVERITVRKSLEMLVQDGLVEKRAGVGSFVRSAKVEPVREEPVTVAAVSKTLLFVMHRDNNDIHSNPSAFNSMLFFAMERACKNRGYTLVFVAVNAGEDVPALIRQNNASGVFLVSKLPTDFYDVIIRNHTPVICLNHYDERMLSVVPDNTDGAYMGVSRLAQLGHRRIGFIGGIPEFFNAMERFDGYRKALLYSDLPFDPNLVQFGNWTYESGFQGMVKLLAQPERPTAVFAASDMMAIGAMACIRQAGLSVPNDISVIGFDGIEACKLCSPQLTSIAVDSDQMAEVACEQMDMQIRNGFSAYNRYMIRLRTRLIERASLLTE